MNAAFQKADSPLENSGIDWLGEIPADWKTKKLKFVTKIRKRIAGYEGPDVLSITQQGIKVKDIESGEGQLAQNYSGYQLVFKGDFAMNHMDLLTGYVDISNFDGVVSPDYRVFTNESEEILDEFLLLIFQIGYRQRIFFRYGQGVSLLGRWRFPAENFNEFVIPLPPLDVQKCIIDFLRVKTDKIDRAVKIKEGQIGLLRERKQIIIQEAVTKGLNPDATMKDSGIDWIGQIPAHWDVLPLLTQAKIKSITNCADWELLSVYLDKGVIRFSDVDEKRTNATSLDLSNYQAVEPGDLVLNNQQAWRGSVGVSNHTGIVSPAYIVLKLSEAFDSDFANYYFRVGTTVAHYLINSKGVGTIQRNLYWPKLKRAPITIPPVEEQKEIVRHIDRQVAKVEAAVELKERQIEALKEYKATLVNAAVTGKIKVI